MCLRVKKRFSKNVDDFALPRLMKCKVPILNPLSSFKLFMISRENFKYVRWKHVSTDSSDVGHARCTTEN